MKVNGTLLEWLGRGREELLGRRFSELLTPGGRIYHETHFAPLLTMQGSVSGIALELRRADRSRLAVLVSSALKRDGAGTPLMIRTTLFDATDRRRYERELLLARDRERVARERVERLQRTTAALAEREAEVAHALQRSLLETVPLDDPRVAVGTSYRPAVETLDIGGDWYDVFPLGTRRIGIVVGDVVGRGIQAATVMGQLRSATRALAGARLGGPAAVLMALDRFAAQLPLALMATLAYAEIWLDDGEVRYACAGHPPPLLHAPGAAPVVLEDGRWLPLGVPAWGERATEGRATLTPGARLLLYTDGLVERRGESLDVGLRRLLTAVGEDDRGDPQALVDGLVTAAADGGEGDDDVCALCVGYRGGERWFP